MRRFHKKTNTYENTVNNSKWGFESCNKTRDTHGTSATGGWGLSVSPFALQVSVNYLPPSLDQPVKRSGDQNRQ